MIIPVLLLLTALVVDVGNWYTHKRQLQNRADAAAFAAGVAYGKNWKACVQTADLALKASTAQKIADTARQYAGDPDATDYAGGVLPYAREHADREPGARQRGDQLDELRRQHRLLRRLRRRRRYEHRRSLLQPPEITTRRRQHLTGRW